MSRMAVPHPHRSAASHESLLRLLHAVERIQASTAKGTTAASFYVSAPPPTGKHAIAVRRSWQQHSRPARSGPLGRVWPCSKARAAHAAAGHPSQLAGSPLCTSARSIWRINLSRRFGQVTCFDKGRHRTLGEEQLTEWSHLRELPGLRTLVHCNTADW